MGHRGGRVKFNQDEKFTHISPKGYFEYDNLWKISSNFLCENKIYKNRFFKNEQTRGTLVKLYAPPPMSQNLKTEYSGIFQKTGIFHFLAILVCPMYFFWNIPKFHISQIFGNWYVPKLKMEYPNIPSYSKKLKSGMSQIFSGISHIPNLQDMCMSQI